MSDVMSVIVVPLAIGAVAVVLLLGLLNMTRGGSPHTSQRLMRWRVMGCCARPWVLSWPTHI